MNAAILEERFDPDCVDGLPPLDRVRLLRERVQDEAKAFQDRLAIHREFELDQALEDELVPTHELRLRRPCGCCDE